MSRFVLPWVALACGCASAIEPRETTDAAPQHDATAHDAPATTDGTPPRIDAAIDAPASGCAFTGILATWTLTGASGSQVSTPVTSTATGVTAGDLTRSAALTAASGADSMNSSGWSTSAQRDTTKYYTLSLTPPAGCAANLTMMSIDLKSSGTGPAMAEVATSIDTFTATTPASTSAASTPALSANATGAIELRVYGYAATGASGTMRVENTVTISGSIQ